MKGYSYRAETGIQKHESIDQLVEKVGVEDLYFWADFGADDFESEIQRTGELMDLHPLTIEDTLTPGSRPIVDSFPEYFYILARTPGQDSQIGELETRQLSLVVGGNYLLTFHRKRIKPLEKLSGRVRQNPDKYFGKGIDYLAYQILDRIIETHFPVLDRIDEEIDRIEEEVLNDPDEELLARISDLRSDLIQIQRTTAPQREMVSKLARAETPFISEDRKVYFRDLQDDLARISDLLANYRDLVTGARDMYMNTMSNRMNEIMKTLTIVATIFIPLTFIAGIYGMNFEIMPELGWDWGYFGALGVMGATALGMVYYFMKKNWF